MGSIYINEAVCNGKVASVKLMLEHEWDKCEVYKKPGDLKRRHLFGKNEYYDDYLINYNKIHLYTPNELSEYFGPIAFSINKNDKVILWPQVIIHYQESGWKGRVEMRYFKTNDEAKEFYNSLVNEYNLQPI